MLKIPGQAKDGVVLRFSLLPVLLLLMVVTSAVAVRVESEKNNSSTNLDDDSVQVLGTTAPTYWYVDNAVSTSGDGRSWSTAWSSFANIEWDTDGPSGPIVGVGAGDTLYISGGSASKTYYETLTVEASGVSGSFITIDVGANSPSPAGHSGTVIIDGENTKRQTGILIKQRNYITVNGRVNDGSNAYKLLVQNHLGSPDPPGSIHVRSCDHVNIDYVKVINNQTRGIFFNGYGIATTNSRIRGCDIRTEITDYLNTDNQLDGIYSQWGKDNIIENNTVILSVNGTNHNDALQFANAETNITVRGNWFEHLNGYGNADSQAIMASGVTGYANFYNNVMIGSSKHQWQAVLLWAGSGTGVWNFWNNTVIAQNTTTGIALHLGRQDTDARIGTFKNNIFYSPNSYPVYAEASFTPSKFDYNLLYRATTGAVAYMGGAKTWAQWQTLGADVHGLNTDPNWNTSNGYRLNSTSRAINAGTSLSANFTNDRDGVTRPQGAAWDIGAYEYNGGVIVPTYTPTPTTKPTSTPTPTQTVSPPTPTPSVTTFSVGSWFEAESISPKLPFTSSNGLVCQPSETSDVTKGGRAVYKVNIPENGNYIVNTMIKAETDGNNSFFVNFDINPDANPLVPDMIWDIQPITTGIQERKISWRGTTGDSLVNLYNPKVFALNAGTQYLIIVGREANTCLDKIYISKTTSATPTPTLTIRPTATPTLTIRPTTTPTPTVPPASPPGVNVFPVGSWFEAENGMIDPVRPFEQLSGTIYQANEASVTTGGKVTYQINIPEDGTYIVKTMVKAETDGYNSFYANFDADPIDPNMIWDVQPKTVGIQERTISWRGNGSDLVNEYIPQIFTLRAGVHNLNFIGREAKTYLDKIGVFKIAPQGSMITVYAAGTPSSDIYPTMQLLIDDKVVSTWTDVRGNYKTGEYLRFSFTSAEEVSANRVKVAFVNDASRFGIDDRNLYVDKITIDGQPYETELSTTYAVGSYKKFGCRDGFTRSIILSCNGYFQYQAK